MVLSQCVGWPCAHPSSAALWCSLGVCVCVCVCVWVSKKEEVRMSEINETMVLFLRQTRLKMSQKKKNTSTNKNKGKSEWKTACEDGVDERWEAKRSMGACLSGNSLSDRLDIPPAHAPQTAGFENTPTPTKHPSLLSLPSPIAMAIPQNSLYGENFTFLCCTFNTVNEQTVLAQSIVNMQRVFRSVVSWPSACEVNMSQGAL